MTQIDPKIARRHSSSFDHFYFTGKKKVFSCSLKGAITTEKSFKQLWKSQNFSKRKLVREDLLYFFPSGKVKNKLQSFLQPFWSLKSDFQWSELSTPASRWTWKVVQTFSQVVDELLQEKSDDFKVISFICYTLKWSENELIVSIGFSSNQ